MAPAAAALHQDASPARPGGHREDEAFLSGGRRCLFFSPDFGVLFLTETWTADDPVRLSRLSFWS